MGDTVMTAEEGEFFVIAEVYYDFKKEFILPYENVQLWNYYVSYYTGTTKLLEGTRKIQADRDVTEYLNGKDVFQQSIKKQTVKFFFISPLSLRNMRRFRLRLISMTGMRTLNIRLICL